MTASPARLGLVGCGRLAERGYLPAAGSVDDVEIVAVADRDRERCATVAPGLPAFDGVEELLSSVQVDAVIVASPSEHHVAAARAASRAGVVALVEKPPAPSLAETLKLAALDVPPFISFNRRFDPRLATLGEVARDRGRVYGRLLLHYRRRSWSPHVVADEALVDLGPHLADLARWLTRSDAVAVRARRITAEEAVFEVELERGVVELEGATDRLHRTDYRLAVDGGRAARHQSGGLLAALVGRIRPPRTHQLAESLAGELTALARALRGGDPGALGTVDDGIAAMAILDAARRSSETGGGWVAVSRQGRTS